MCLTPRAAQIKKIVMNVGCGVSYDDLASSVGVGLTVISLGPLSFRLVCR